MASQPQLYYTITQIRLSIILFLILRYIATDPMHAGITGTGNEVVLVSIIYPVAKAVAPLISKIKPKI